MEASRLCWSVVVVSILLSSRYGAMYPKIGVAVMSLCHRCSNLETKEISSTTSMPEYRRLCDMAKRRFDEWMSFWKKQMLV
jgi:hypothetical protein